MNFTALKALACVACVTATFYSCHTIKHLEEKKIETIEGASGNHYTLNPSPNALDTVGVIFAIDKKGIPTIIPGSPVLTVKTSNITTPIIYRSKNTSLELASKFLKVKSADSLASVKFFDTLRTEISFKVSNGTLSRTPDDLSQAFNAVKVAVGNNIKFLGLEDNTFYMILETVKTDSLEITVDGGSGTGGKAAAAFKKMIDLGVSGDTRTRYVNDLIYHKLGEPVTVYYTLRKINIGTTGTKGNSDYKVEPSLGDEEKKVNITGK
ncbi:MAG TPA: hypothetical protein VK666_26535 [Chryseolinea sp.]|nr:hypothetical protein [Chryseolinea sp.]